MNKWITFWQTLADEIIEYEPYDFRIGQMMYNSLYKVDSILANSILGSDTYDPFYDDDNIPDFLEYIKDNLDFNGIKKGI